MKSRIYFLLLSCGFILSILVVTSLIARPARAEGTRQAASCDELLTKILARAGWKSINQPMGDCEYLGAGSNFYATAGMSINPADGTPYVVNSCRDDSNPPCTKTSFHGYPAITAISNGVGNIGWTMPRGATEYRFYIFVGEGTDVTQFADDLVAAAEQELPAAGSSLPEPTKLATEVTPSNADCKGVTPDELRQGGLKVLQCRLHCDPNSLSDQELQSCIDQFSGQSGNTQDNPPDPPVIIPPDYQPGGEVPVIPGDQPGGDQPNIPSPGEIPFVPEDQSGSNQTISLGPLATTPLIPLAGGLIGTAIGWMVSVAVTSGNVIKTVLPTPQPAAPVPARPVEPKIAHPPVEQTPPPPGQPQQTVSPPVDPAAPTVFLPKTPDPLELGFNIVKDTASAIGNVAGVFNKYFSGPDTAETVDAILSASKTWHLTPSLKSAENYLENLKKSNVLREPEISKKMGVLGKGLDVIEALNDARKICEKRGYSGWDALFTTYASVGEKAIVWSLTKNPMVALADAAVGGATQMAFGADNKIDIGAVVKKSADVWDNVTQHAGDRYYRGIEKNADNERMENLRFLTERIRQQVVDGKISRQEGAHRLQRVIDKTNQESPLL